MLMEKAHLGLDLCFLWLLDGQYKQEPYDSQGPRENHPRQRGIMPIQVPSQERAYGLQPYAEDPAPPGAPHEPDAPASDARHDASSLGPGRHVGEKALEGGVHERVGEGCERGEDDDLGESTALQEEVGLHSTQEYAGARDMLLAVFVHEAPRGHPQDHAHHAADQHDASPLLVAEPDYLHGAHDPEAACQGREED